MLTKDNACKDKTYTQKVHANSPTCSYLPRLGGTNSFLRAIYAPTLFNINHRGFKALLL